MKFDFNQFLSKGKQYSSYKWWLNYSIHFKNQLQQLNEYHHILNSDKFSGFYKTKLSNIYYKAIDNYKHNNLENPIDLCNDENLYQCFTLNFIHLPKIKIYIAISPELSEQYMSIISDDYTDYFNDVVYKESENNIISSAIYSIIITLNENDIIEKYTEYNIGALYHEFTHIFQSIKDKSIKQNCNNAFYVADNLLRNLNNKSLLNLNDSNLIKELSHKNNYSENEIYFIIACCIYYLDYSEKYAHLQSVKAEIKLNTSEYSEIYDYKKRSIIINNLINNKNRLETFCLISNTYKKYFYLYKILQNIKTIGDNENKLSEYFLEIDIKKCFRDLKYKKCNNINDLLILYKEKRVING